MIIIKKLLLSFLLLTCLFSGLFANQHDFFFNQNRLTEVVSGDLDLDTIFTHLYLVGDDLGTIDGYSNNDTVTTWTGRTNSNKSMVQVGGGGLYAENLVNGHDAFDGTSVRMENTTSVTWSGDWSIGFVAKMPSVPSGVEYPLRETGSSTIFHRAGTNDAFNFRIDGSGGSLQREDAFTGQPLRGNWFACIARYDNSEARITMDFYVSGGVINLIDHTGSSVGDIVASDIRFVYTAIVFEAWAELGIVEGFISDADRNTTFDLWATKYNL